MSKLLVLGSRVGQARLGISAGLADDLGRFVRGTTGSGVAWMVDADAALSGRALSSCARSSELRLPGGVS